MATKKPTILDIFKQKIQQTANKASSLIKPFITAAGKQPLLQGPGLLGPQMKLPFSPTVGQYTKGQIVKPIQQGVQQVQQEKKKGLVYRAPGLLSMAGGAFSATPVGIGTNIATGIASGIGKSIRTKTPVQQTIKKDIANPTSFAQEGLGVKNPFLAGAIDFATSGNPTKGVGKVATTIKRLKGYSPRSFDIHPEDQKVMGDFINAVQVGAAKKELGKLGVDAQRLAEHYIGKSAQNISNEKLAKAFDAMLSSAAKGRGEDALQMPFPKMGFTQENKVGSILKQGTPGTRTVGQMQQATQMPDLTTYENALNKGDTATLTALAAKYPTDTRFQLHKSLGITGEAASVKGSTIPQPSSGQISLVPKGPVSSLPPSIAKMGIGGNSGHIPPPQPGGEGPRIFPRKPQELNVNRLNLSDEQKAHVVSLESNEIRKQLGDKQVLQIAKDAGIDTKTYTIDQTAQKIAGQLNVRRDLDSMENKLKTVSDLLQREGIIKQIAEQSRVSRTQGTDIGRQLAARRIIANELDSPMQRVFKLLDNAGVNPEKYTKEAAKVNFDNPEEVVNFYRQFVPPKASEWLDLDRYNSMLSSPKTHEINASSNLFNTGVIAPIEHTVTGGLDFFASKLTGKKRSAFAGEGGAYTKEYYALKNIKQAGDKFIQVMRNKQLIENLDLQHIPLSVGQKGVRGAIAKTLEIPLRFLEGADQFFMQLTKAGEEGALKYRQAKGVKITDLASQATENAKYRLYRSKLGAEGRPQQGHVLNAIDFVGKTILQARNSKNPYISTIGKFTFPFVTTPTNIIKQGIEYSPAGLLTLHGAKNKTEQLSKVIIGTTTAASAAMLLASGRLSWATPTDPTKKAAFDKAHILPYAIKVGNHWVQYSKLPPPIAFNFALIAGLDDALKNKTADQSLVDAVLSSVAKYGNFLADQSYLKSMGDTLAAVKGDPEAYARAFSNAPQQLVPFRALGGWLARLTDNYQRKVDTDKNFVDQQVQQLMMNIPGLSQNLPKRLGPNGELIENQNKIFNAFSPVNVSNVDKAGEQYYNDLLLASKIRKEAGNTQQQADKAAQTLYDDLKKMPPAQANKRVEQLDDKTYEAIQRVAEARQGDQDKEIVRNLHVTDGSRAKFIWQKLQELDTPEEKNAYIDKMDKLINDDVYDQLIELKNKSDQQPKEQSNIFPVFKTPQAYASDKLIHQPQTEVTQQFGEYNPAIEIFSGGVNQGTDVAAKEGTPLTIPTGTWKVIDSYSGEDMNSGYGRSVFVENTQTGEKIRLSHLNNVDVQPGETVTRGDILGTSGVTGNTTGPHVDIEYYDENGNLSDIMNSAYKLFL